MLFFQGNAKIVKQSVAVSVNSALRIMYWHIGKTIGLYVLDGRQPENGE